MPSSRVAATGGAVPGLHPQLPDRRHLDARRPMRLLRARGLRRPHQPLACGGLLADAIAALGLGPLRGRGRRENETLQAADARARCANQRCRRPPTHPAPARPATPPTSASTTTSPSSPPRPPHLHLVLRLLFVLLCPPPPIRLLTITLLLLLILFVVLTLLVIVFASL